MFELIGDIAQMKVEFLCLEWFLFHLFYCCTHSYF